MNKKSSCSPSISDGLNMSARKGLSNKIIVVGINKCQKVKHFDENLVN